ncbi:hypothetical protein HDU81_005322 [Chytriomyces hyalinus]|nr:hypothetical protein HDU81_005322 [Chytriomyces hyalinus]
MNEFQAAIEHAPPHKVDGIQIEKTKFMLEKDSYARAHLQSEMDLLDQQQGAIAALEDRIVELSKQVKACEEEVRHPDTNEKVHMRHLSEYDCGADWWKKAKLTADTPFRITHVTKKKANPCKWVNERWDNRHFSIELHVDWDPWRDNIGELPRKTAAEKAKALLARRVSGALAIDLIKSTHVSIKLFLKLIDYYKQFLAPNVDTKSVSLKMAEEYKRDSRTDTNEQRIISAMKSLQTIPQPASVLTFDMQGVDGILDLLYSSEIYDDETSLGIKMPVDELLKINRNTIILLGASACGKTRTCYDYARHRWSLFFDCFQDSDVQAVIGLLKVNSPPIKNDENQNAFEVLSKKFINSLIAARLLVLQVMRNQHNIDCFKWHCMQRSPCLKQLFTKVFLELSSYSTPAVLRIFHRLRTELDGRVIFDESQHLLTVLQTCYRAPNLDQQGIANNQLEFPRSFYSFVTQHVASCELKSIL